jgi:hypothetical protein
MQVWNHLPGYLCGSLGAVIMSLSGHEHASGETLHQIAQVTIDGDPADLTAPYLSTFAEDLASTAFSQSDIDEMLKILASNQKIHKTDDETAREHVTHCLHQMVRLPHLAIVHGGKFRAAQWGLNLGRAQQILDSVGGIDAWWRAFKDIEAAEDWPRLKSKAETYIRLLQLPMPSKEYINRD